MNESFNPNGEDLAKVLVYFGLIPDASQDSYKIVCPFHNDVNPSMMIDLIEGRYYCFGCSRSGNAYDFVKTLYEGKLNDLQSLIKYFKILKSNKVCKIKIHNKPKPRKESEEKLNEAKDYFYGLRTVNWYDDASNEVLECLEYMYERGFREKDLNFANAKVTYNEGYPIIFPMLDNGVFRGWVCRTNNPQIAKRRKYLYNEGFSRATTLVGRYSDNCIPIICEGYMDYLKFSSFGVKNVVAILGWKITSEQINKLKEKGIKKVISALDNDECGIKGTEYLKKYFEVIRFDYDSNIKDAGEMNKALFNKMMYRTNNLAKKGNCRK